MLHRRGGSYIGAASRLAIGRNPSILTERIYLDHAATTPVLPEARSAIAEALGHWANPSSPHAPGRAARAALEAARRQVAEVLGWRHDVILTSGASEAIAIAAERAKVRRRLRGATEHDAVAAAMGEAARVLPVDGNGVVDLETLAAALAEGPALVAVQQVNNETGVIQPVADIADALADHPAYFHVDAAQGFGKDIDALRNSRVDLISISGHKLCAPKGIGALIARRRDGDRPPLAPLTFGGGQERGLRPGTLPVPLIAGFGLAAELAASEWATRREHGIAFRARALAALSPLDPVVNGDPARTLPNILSVSIPNIEAEEAMDALDGTIAISNGSACTSHALACSHVLGAMGLSTEQSAGTLRLSWCHLTPEPDWDAVVRILRGLRG